MRSTPIASLPTCALVMMLMALAIHADTPTQSVSFVRSVVNLESLDTALQQDPPPSVRRAPPKDPRLWFGEVFRQLPGDPPTSRAHNVPFAVLLEDGVVIRAWSDGNLNGDLTDDPRPRLYGYPGESSTRSFLTTLHWFVGDGARRLSIERTVRIVVRAPQEEGGAPDNRIQDVFGMTGEITIGGVHRHAILFDGNHDGRYTRGHGDGMFVDLDGDGTFVIDPMAPEFGPFAIPFEWAGRTLSVDSVTVDGSRVMLSDRGPAPASRSPVVGNLAPDFSFVDTEGRLQRLSAHRGRPAVVYFWASWCANCRGDALLIRDWAEHPAGLEADLLGICLDTDRASARKFREEFGLTWPTSFSGGYTAEDPVARLYREPGVGVFYLVGADGRLVDRAFDFDQIKADLAKLVPPEGPRAER